MARWGLAFCMRNVSLRVNVYFEVISVIFNVFGYKSIVLANLSMRN